MSKGNWIVEDVQDWVDPIFVPQCLPKITVYTSNKAEAHQKKT